MELLHRAMAHFHGAALDLLRDGAWLVIFGIVFTPLEQIFSQTTKAIFRPQWGVDLAY